jgi:hypothetical protein
MDGGISDDLAWRSSHYLAVYGVLTAYADSGLKQLPPGTDGVLVRAQNHFRRAGERAAIARLDAISVTLFRLRQTLLARAEADYDAARRELELAARDWLLGAPMFPQDPPLELVA